MGITTLRTRGWTVAILLASGVLTACVEGDGFNPFQTSNDEAADAPRSTKIVERDVESPEVFSVTEAGLWDGRPSLGGVWVAHPTAKDPERVIIRNSSNGKFVIGALFRRDLNIPGPRLQVSSDAAAALGMLAGQPVELNVTALRREEVAEEVPAETEPASDSGTPEVTSEALGTVAVAEAAISEAEAKTAKKPAESAATPKASPLDKPYIQIGIFSVEANAKTAAGQMRNAGMIPIIKDQSLKGKKFWRVIVGPAQSRAERAALLKTIKETGFTDAYAVTN